MKATDVLRAQHRVMERLFDALGVSEDGIEKAGLFEELGNHLMSHDAIEREIFYPLCEERLGMSSLLGGAMVENGVLEFCLYEAESALMDDSFDFKINVLRTVARLHFFEEEAQLLPIVDMTVSASELEQIGEVMQRHFAAARRSDFRSMLRDNLNQVLAGSIYPKMHSEPPPKGPFAREAHRYEALPRRPAQHH